MTQPKSGKNVCSEGVGPFSTVPHAGDGRCFQHVWVLPLGIPVVGPRAHRGQGEAASRVGAVGQVCVCEPGSTGAQAGLCAGPGNGAR